MMMFSIKRAIFLVLVMLQLWMHPITGNPDAKRLYDDLLSNYNRLIRPVSNNTETVLVKLGLRLSQLIDLVCQNEINSICRNSFSQSFHPFIIATFFFLIFFQNLKDQILTTNVWLEHVSICYSVATERLNGNVYQTGINRVSIG